MVYRVSATLKGCRVSEQKGRLVANVIRGRKVSDAIAILSFMPQKSAVLFKKLLDSALANAENQSTVDIDNLVVATVTVDRGAKLKRFTARAKGRGDRIEKPSSHFYIALEG